MPMICVRTKAEYFCAPIWTTQIALKWLVEFAFARSVFGNQGMRDGAVGAC
jgi:hypothetical protein